MSQTSRNPNDLLQAEVEALTSAAKKLSAEGQGLQALETYKTASGLMLGAPWLQLRTAEMARKLRQPEVATLHYRRAAAAFVRAGFEKRALAPLRTAWQVSASLLPRDAGSFITITVELIQVQRELGFSAEATATFEQANQALKAVGSAERVPEVLALEARSSGPEVSAEATGTAETLPNNAGISAPAPSASAAQR